MKITFGPDVDRRVKHTTMQLNQAAISQGMAYHGKRIADPCGYDERLRRRKKGHAARRARALHRRHR